MQLSRSSGALGERLARGEVIDLRGDGKAGGGLVLAVQSFAAAIRAGGELDVQDWPLFSAARRGANVRAFLRVARTTVEATCQVTAPDVAILMNEAAAGEVDFAEGTRDAIYVVNTPDGPDVVARRYRLGGTVWTIAGDQLGMRHLGRPLGNIAVLAALVRATGLTGAAAARAVLATQLGKRRVSPRLIDANLALYEDALASVKVATGDAGADTDHRQAPFAGYGHLPVGGQSALRTARSHLTSGYGRPGVRIEFADPASRCSGCALCVVQCPEGIITFEPDRARGPIVHGARFTDYCKRCRECVAACPLDLFAEVPAVSRPDGALDMVP